MAAPPFKTEPEIILSDGSWGSESPSMTQGSEVVHLRYNQVKAISVGLDAEDAHRVLGVDLGQDIGWQSDSVDGPAALDGGGGGDLTIGGFEPAPGRLEEARHVGWSGRGGASRA